MSVAASPIYVGTSRQFLLDDRFVDRSERLTRVMHRPTSAEITIDRSRESHKESKLRMHSKITVYPTHITGEIT